MFPSYPLERVPWSLGAVLNAFAGVLNVLAKAVGSVAADPDNSQESGDDQQNNDTFNECTHICFITIVYVLIHLADGGPLFLTRPQAITV